MNFKFPRDERLKSEKQIQKLFDEGSSVRHAGLKLIYLKKETEGVKLQVAFAAPKKNFPSAVTRNRIKRLMREAYRLQKHLIFNKIEGRFTFMILYLGKEIPTFPEMEKAVNKLFHKFLNRVNDEEVAK